MVGRRHAGRARAAAWRFGEAPGPTPGGRTWGCGMKSEVKWIRRDRADGDPVRQAKLGELRLLVTVACEWIWEWSIVGPESADMARGTVYASADDDTCLDDWDYQNVEWAQGRAEAVARALRPPSKPEESWCFIDRGTPDDAESGRYIGPFVTPERANARRMELGLHLAPIRKARRVKASELGWRQAWDSFVERLDAEHECPPDALADWTDQIVHVADEGAADRAVAEFLDEHLIVDAFVIEPGQDELPLEGRSCA